MKAEGPASASLFPQFPSGTASDSCESEGSSGGENRHFPFLPQHWSCCLCAGVLSQRGKKAKTRTNVIVSHCSVFISLTSSRLGLAREYGT